MRRKYVVDSKNLPPVLNVPRIEELPDAYIRASSEVFAFFGAQESGNASYGVRIGDDQFFIKTPGLLQSSRPYFQHSDRVALLRNAARLSQSCNHPALVYLHRVIESPEGPLLVYEWVHGELLRGCLERFRALPTNEILGALDAVIGVHRQLAESGWVAVDFYDGSLLYDFERRQIHIIDLDMYRAGSFTNEMGRMFGSSRFMAPEEFELGAVIDERTTVFTMGRTISVLLSDGTLGREPFAELTPCTTSCATPAVTAATNASNPWPLSAPLGSKPVPLEVKACQEPLDTFPCAHTKCHHPNKPLRNLRVILLFLL